jgi:outer membrane protein
MSAYDNLRSCYILLVILILSTLSSSVEAESLEDAWKIALVVDQRIKASQRTTESAQHSLYAAKAALLPSLTVESEYTVLNNEPAFKVSLPTVPGLPPIPLEEIPFAQDKSASFKATVTLPLFTSWRISRNIDAASSQLNAARMDEDRTELDIKLEVAEAYITVLRARRGVEVAESSVAGLNAHAKDVEDLFKHDLVAKNDLLAAQVALADARQRAIQAHNALDVSCAAYNRLLGRPLTHPVEVDEVLPEPIQVDVDTLTRQALSQRPELSGLEEQAQALRYQASSIRAENGPQVAVSGGYSFQQNRFLVHENVWSAILGLKWNIFDGGIKRQEAYAIAQKAEALSNLRGDLVSTIALQVRQAWLDVEETHKRIEVAREAIAQAEENLKVANDRYRNSLGTNTEVLDAETLRTRSQTNYYNAVYDAVLATLRLHRVVGNL